MPLTSACTLQVWRLNRTLLLLQWCWQLEATRQWNLLLHWPCCWRLGHAGTEHHDKWMVRWLHSRLRCAEVQAARGGTRRTKSQPQLLVPNVDGSLALHSFAPHAVFALCCSASARRLLLHQAAVHDHELRVHPCAGSRQLENDVSESGSKPLPSPTSTWLCEPAWSHYSAPKAAGPSEGACCKALAQCCRRVAVASRPAGLHFASQPRSKRLCSCQTRRRTGAHTAPPLFAGQCSC